MPRKSKQFYSRLFVVAVVITVLDVGLLAHYLYEQHQRNNLITAATSALGSNNVPSSEKPSAHDVNNYQVGPTLPKYLLIPSLHVKTRVKALAIGKSNQLQAPGDIYDVGWYNASALPGQPGAMFMDGHVSSWSAKGVFYDLKKLKAGDTVQVVRGDNKTFTYVVNKLQTSAVADVNMQQVLSPVIAGQSGLNLMTCTGSVIKGTSEFSERLVVYTTLKT